MAEVSSRHRAKAKRFERVLHSVLRACVVASFALSARTASAQVHWDASAQVGVMKRFLGSRPEGANDVGFGPTAQVTGHVALLPFAYVGGYFGHDISPLPGDGSARNITFGGVRAKGMLPWIGGSGRAWVFLGFGYAGVYSQSFKTTFSIPTGEGDFERRQVRVERAGGSFVDLPFGVGASYKLRAPFELCAELGGRLGFGFTGSVYTQPGPQVTVPDYAGQNASPAGLDRFALGLTLGVLLDL